jgi:hypothetical protein
VVVRLLQEKVPVLERSTALLLVKLLQSVISSAVILLGTLCIPAQAQDSDLVFTSVAEAQLDSLASRVGEKIKKNNRDERPAKVLVFDFTWKSPEISSDWGRFSQTVSLNS